MYRGISVHWDESTSAMARVLAAGDFEPHIVPLFEQLVSPGMTVIDLGAHLGVYTLLAALGVGPRGRVYAFEPDPRVRALLEENVAANGFNDRVRVVGRAVRDAASRVELYLGRTPELTSLTRPAEKGVQGIKAEATSLDEFFSSEGWPEVGLIKMDIEGSEKPALEGMKEFCRRQKRLALIIEFIPEVMQAAGTSPEDIFHLLRLLGFNRICGISLDQREPLPLETEPDLRGFAERHATKHPYLLAQLG